MDDELEDLTDRMTDPVTSTVDPPMAPAERELPLRKLDWPDFEKLVRDMAERVRGLRQVRCYGRRGQKQFGIDVYGMRETDGKYEVLQARNIASVSADYIRGAAATYENDGRRLDGVAFVLCVAGAHDDTAIDDALVELRRQFPFAVELWDGATMSRLLRDHPDLVFRYFGSMWRSAFCGEAGAAETRERRTPPLADALLLGPVQALGLEDDARIASDVSGDPARALNAARRLIERLVDGGYAQVAERWRRYEGDALAALGEPNAAFDIRFDLTINSLRSDPTLPTATILYSLDLDVDETRAARRDALSAFASWSAREPALPALTAAARELISLQDRYAPTAALWLAEAALLDRDREIYGVAHELALIAEPVCDDSQMMARLLAARADLVGEEAWAPLRKQAMTRRIPAAEASFVCARAARFLAWADRPQDAVDFYRRAIELAIDVRLEGDARAYLNALQFIERRTGIFRADQGAGLVGALGVGTFLDLSLGAAERASAARTAGRHADLHDHLWHQLLQSQMTGRIDAEIEAHAQLGQLFADTHEYGGAAYHFALSGRAPDAKAAAGSLLAPLTPSELDLEAASWHRAGVFAVVQAQADLMSNDDVQQLLQEMISATAEEGPLVGPHVAIEAFRALGAVAPLLDEAAAMQVLRAFDPIENADGGTHVDDAYGSLLGSLLRVHSALRPEIERRLYRLLITEGRSDVAVQAISRARFEVPDLDGFVAPLADEGSIAAADALCVLDVQHPAIAAVARTRAEVALARPRSTERQGWSLSSGFDLGTAHLRSLEPELLSAVVDRMLVFAEDNNDLARNRANAIHVLGAASSLLDSPTRLAVFDRVLSIAESPQLSEADRFVLSTQHPRSRFRIGSTPDSLPAAAVKAATHLAPSDPERRRALAAATAFLMSGSERAYATYAHVAVTLGSSFVDAAALSKSASVDLRRAAAYLIADLPHPDAGTAMALAGDSDMRVRLELAVSLRRLDASHPELARIVREALAHDRSVSVRLASRPQPG